MAAPSLLPDPLDLDILREMYRGGEGVYLAGIDPRVNATRLSKRLHVGRARVAARLRAWSRSGFLVRYDVWVNPALLGCLGAWVSLRVDHHRSKPALIVRLGLVEGVVQAFEFLGAWVSLAVVAPDPATLARRAGLLRALAGVEEIEGPVPWTAPQPKRPLSPLDVRIVRALRDRPTATLSATARRVGISTRTMTRRYAALLEDWAVWFVPVFDFRAISYPVVALTVTLRSEVGREAVARGIRSRYPLTLEPRMPSSNDPAGTEVHVFFVMPPSAAHLEELERYVGSLPGVVEVEPNIMVRSHTFPAWFDRQLAAIDGRRR